MPTDGVRVPGFNGPLVEEDAVIYLESNEPRHTWATRYGMDTYFGKVVYWRRSDTTQEPEVIPETAKDKKRWLWFWGLHDHVFQ